MVTYLDNVPSTLLKPCVNFCLLFFLNLSIQFLKIEKRSKFPIMRPKMFVGCFLPLLKIVAHFNNFH